MNELTRTLRQHATTQAAEGLPRLKWTLEEFERLSDLGFFGGIDRERERLELIDGELVPMHAKGSRHEWVRAVIMNHFAKRLPDDLHIFSEPGWRPGGDLYLEPEMIICPVGFQPSTVPPGDVLLLIEVADTSLKYDEGLKAKIYAMLGVREYWVVDAKGLNTLVHREPVSESYKKNFKVSASETLTPLFVPGLSVSLGSLGLD